MMQTIHVRPKPLRGCSCCMGGVASILSGLTALFVLGLVVLLVAGEFLVVGDELRYSDAVVVLGGSDLQRLNEAAQLYNDHYAGRVILTETGEAVPGREDVSYTEMRRQELEKLGVARDNILVTQKTVLSTLEEAKAVRDLMSANEWQTCIVVTDPYHTRRTRLIFRDVLSETEIKVRVRPARDHWYRASTWWLSVRGWEMTVLEYAKLFGFLAGLRD